MAILYPFSPGCADLLARPPETGRGRHGWLWEVAVRLKGSRYKPKKIEEALTKICAAKGWEDRLPDVEDILDKLAAEGDAPRERKSGEDWPEPHDDARRARFGFPPIFAPEGDTGLKAADVLPVLFPGNPLVCFGWSQKRFTTLPLSALLPQAQVTPFIVANPMTAERAPNGSRRSLAIASPPAARKHLVIELDTHETRAEQAAVLSSLHTPAAPLVLVVWSGGKSLHGWFDVSGLSPYLTRRLFRFAVWLGADESLFQMAALVRMPGGRRDNGQRQTIVHFNPKKG